MPGFRWGGYSIYAVLAAGLASGHIVVIGIFTRVCSMLSTMQDLPLNLSRILTYGATVFAKCKVTTWESGVMQETTFAEIAARAAALAHALDGLGITGDQRVATFMFNCTEHVERIPPCRAQLPEKPSSATSTLQPPPTGLRDDGLRN